MLDLGLTGKVAIVTGGSEGLGRATAMRFAAEGCHVVICARRKDVLEQAAETIRKQTGVQVLAQAADVTRPADVEVVVAATLAAQWWSMRGCWGAAYSPRLSRNSRSLRKRPHM